MKRKRNTDETRNTDEKREKGPGRDCHRRRLLEREVCGRKVSQLFKNKTSFSRKRIKELPEFFKYSTLGMVSSGNAG